MPSVWHLCWMEPRFGQGRPCANNLDVVGMGVTKWSQHMSTNLLPTTPWTASLASMWEMRVRRSADMYGSPKEKAKLQSLAKEI